ncbi:MAG TPA: universal stress protein [Acidobacteriota bacterium]|nr:universal stress protein [Acidobacteriota bacterium]
MQLNKVIAATDFSEASLVALETVFNLNLDEGATIYVVHVLDMPAGIDPMGTLGPSLEEFKEEARQKLAGMIPANVPENVSIQTVVLRGTPSKAISEFARQQDADLIVVSTHGRSGLARLLMGSTAETVLRKAPCQVLVAKHKAALLEELPEDETIKAETS